MDHTMLDAVRVSIAEQRHGLALIERLLGETDPEIRGSIARQRQHLANAERFLDTEDAVDRGHLFDLLVTIGEVNDFVTDVVKTLEAGETVVFGTGSLKAVNDG